MKIQNRYIKISSAKENVEHDYPIGTEDVGINLIGSIVKEEHLNNQNGTVDVVYVFKAHDVDISGEAQ